MEPARFLRFESIQQTDGLLGLADRLVSVAAADRLIRPVVNEPVYPESCAATVARVVTNCPAVSRTSASRPIAAS
ncbi:hypothetical protein [Mycolicibacterium sp. CBMA 226]|uniref:hypothetical protein n=1 Tax=Mycolicibacterium sp. CBMA 226 TaxID=2606611 RepID=UPI0012DDAD64|nr:hypothetical protein [Mycolicibacterium sp. CBMA 226]MUL78666.1 hypothetical protein [Mycolicibacterium sp. CBMA 226]